jgi:Tfp pilus assembly protein FimT
LIVVVAIVAVLATLIVPRLHGSAGTARLRTGASRLLSAARYARAFAASRREPCRLVLDTEEHRYVLARVEQTATQPARLRAMRTGIGKAEHLGTGVRFGEVRIRSLEPEASRRKMECIIFRPSGRADAAVVEVTDGRRTYSLLVTPHTGRAELVKGSVTELPDDRVDLDE